MVQVSQSNGANLAHWVAGTAYGNTTVFVSSPLATGEPSFCSVRSLSPFCGKLFEEAASGRSYILNWLEQSMRVITCHQVVCAAAVACGTFLLFVLRTQSDVQA